MQYYLIKRSSLSLFCKNRNIPVRNKRGYAQEQHQQHQQHQPQEEEEEEALQPSYNDDVPIDPLGSVSINIKRKAIPVKSSNQLEDPIKLFMATGSRLFSVPGGKLMQVNASPEMTSEPDMKMVDPDKNWDGSDDKTKVLFAYFGG